VEEAGGFKGRAEEEMLNGDLHYNTRMGEGKRALQRVPHEKAGVAALHDEKFGWKSIRGLEFFDFFEFVSRL